jgi:hypothetical protein
MSRKVQCSANAAGKSWAVSKQTIETEELQTQCDDAKAAKKLSDQAVKDLQVKLSAAKGTTRRKYGRAAAPASALLVATSSGHVVSPPRRPRAASVSITAPPSMAGEAPSVSVDTLPPAAGEEPFPIAMFAGESGVEPEAEKFGEFGDMTWWQNFEFAAALVPKRLQFPYVCAPH